MSFETTTQFEAPQVPTLEELATFEFTDEAKDQIGTFAVAIFVAALATLARLAVARKNRWWLNMVIIHGVIFAYWATQCHSNESATPWLTTIHGGLCWRDTEGHFQKIIGTGSTSLSSSERLFINVLVWLAILGNVVPAYATGNEANRHMTHVKKRACNPLVNHIIAGILCVVFPYFVVTWKVSILIPVAVILDIYHQITIHRLIANHDGIWVLRAVSMSLAISKWIVILNMYTTDATGMLDQMFIMSTGFLGTRAYAATAYIAYYFGMGDIKTAQWYSIGLMMADIGIMGRCWGQMRISFWLTVVNCAAMHYHQMWKKFIHLRPAFVGMCCVVTMIVTHSGQFASLMFTIVWMIGNFMLPHFNRYRPAPPKGQVCTPTVSTKFVEMSKAMTERLGRRLSRRMSGFRKSQTLDNSRQITSTSLLPAFPSSSNFETPRPKECLATPVVSQLHRCISTPRIPEMNEDDLLMDSDDEDAQADDVLRLTRSKPSFEFQASPEGRLSRTSVSDIKQLQEEMENLQAKLGNLQSQLLTQAIRSPRSA